MTLGERIDLAREALAQGLAPLPIVLSALEIPRATWYYYQKQKVEADRKREEEERRLKRAIEEILLEHPEYGYRRVTEEGRESPSTTSGSTACFRTSTFP
jgi:putative transposase